MNIGISVIIGFSIPVGLFVGYLIARKQAAQAERSAFDVAARIAAMTGEDTYMVIDRAAAAAADSGRTIIQTLESEMASLQKFERAAQKIGSRRKAKRTRTVWPH